MNNTKKIDEMLNSLDGCERAQASAFLYTRLKARMESDLLPKTPRQWFLKPAYAAGIVAIALLVNAVVLFRPQEQSTIAGSESENFQSLASEYRISDNATIFDLTGDRQP